MCGRSQPSCSSRRTPAKTLTLSYPVSPLKQNTLNSCGGRFRLFLNVTGILGHFLVRKSNQLISSNVMSWCNGFFLLVFKKKLMDKQQHHCFSMSVVHQRVKSAENQRAAIYSMGLVLEACDILKRKQFFYILPNKEKRWYVHLF